MFVGWIQKSSLKDDLEKFSQDLLVDKKLILNTLFDKELISFGFGAYKEDLDSIATVVKVDNLWFINNLYYKESIKKDTLKRVLNTLIKNIDIDKSTIVLAKKDEIDIFESLGFKEYAKFKSVLYGDKPAVFNFSTKMAKRVESSQDYKEYRKLDKKAFNIARGQYIDNSLLRESSLMLSTENGFLHSYAINKRVIKISPWIMQGLSYSDAETLLRGVIYHRGLKKIQAIIPSEIDDITSLYKKYEFKDINNYSLMYLNKKPNINLNMIYAI